EGGGVLLGSFFDQRLVDKVHAVVAPMIIGGGTAPTAVAGQGAERMAGALRLRDVTVERLGDDVLVTGYPASEH
ncbi:MAG: dihydrofolate reductase family protein, partial [Dehalococcoidia bacterium]